MKRLFLLVNKRAGSGHGGGVLDALRKKAEALFSRDFTVMFQAAETHPEIERAIREFAAGIEKPSVIIAGGGGGTLGAVINGVCAAGAGPGLPGPERLRIAALRMGSGNVLARHLGAPADPIAGLDAIKVSLENNRIINCCIGCYKFRDKTEKPVARYAATLAGFGLFGKVPGMLSRFHARSRIVYPAMKRLFGLEKTTALEYIGALVIGAIKAMIRTGALAQAEFIGPDGVAYTTRLLAGAVVNFPVPSLPFKPDCRMQDDMVQLFLLPCRSRTDIIAYLLMPWRLRKKMRKIDVKGGHSITIKPASGAAEEFFLDEDTFFFKERIEISTAGFLSFICIDLKILESKRIEAFFNNVL